MVRVLPWTGATALLEPLTARAAAATAPARVPSWTGAASGAARALVEAAVEAEVMATAPARARGSTAAASGAAPAPPRGLPLLARGHESSVVVLPLPRKHPVLRHRAEVCPPCGMISAPSSILFA